MKKVMISIAAVVLTAGAIFATNTVVTSKSNESAACVCPVCDDCCGSTCDAGSCSGCCN